ncbi:putative subtilisin-like protease SBT1.4 [Iris pallida]|uniref:Subtilisin-like protease SBT1.4 n=1 Tax=Iris pallida TaxID=29817 RepID=A0AAX6I3T4_IRIPA|nr:putative subtilisin-like protease SBT1.4 [Iris pallida]
MSKPGSATTISSLLLLLLLLHATANTETPSTYIVHVSQQAARVSSSLLRSLPGPTPRVLYHYTLAARGFSAALTPSQASLLRRRPDVLSVRRDRVRHPHTTHTPSFLRLSNSSGLWPHSDLAADIVVGVLDTGIYPLSRASFDDSGLPPPPPSWRGSCHPSFPCNRKIVGAKFFAAGYEAAHGPVDESKESRSPLDTEGHGTHTASTAAGSEAPGAGFYSYARGTARGMAARARIAAYKICWASGCYDSDILAAMDAAVADGVDVISLSVGASGRPPPFHRDSIAIGAFGAAVRHGVVVSCSAGNSGPGAGTAVNVAPWILTVGASTVDREFPADVALGDGSVLPGVSLYAGEPLPTGSVPLVSGSDCGSRLCIPGNLDSAKVAGKIVLCDRGSNARVEKGSAVKLAGGAGMIMANTAASGEELLADSHLIPATMVGERAGNRIRSYIRSDPSPSASLIFRGTVIGPDPAAPKVASFSSRGPNYRAPEIIKPDVIAPGVNILAAWTGESAPTDLEIDSRRVEFNIISGTSMSCPHVSGLAALLRKARPGWSPAAIKSALMTTAYNSDNSGRTIVDLATGGESTPFVRGSGHVDPNRALDPGLVYDLQPDDYIAFLCSLGYGPQQIGVIARDGVSVNCSSDTAKRLSSPGALNYPSFGVTFSSDADAVTYGRVVKNVGGGAAIYEARVSSPAGVNVTVSPSRLVFGAEGESLSYEITFASAAGSADSRFGWISWGDGVHEVRSPIAVSWRSHGLVDSI